MKKKIGLYLSKKISGIILNIIIFIHIKHNNNSLKYSSLLTKLFHIYVYLIYIYAICTTFVREKKNAISIYNIYLVFAFAFFQFWFFVTFWFLIFVFEMQDVRKFAIATNCTTFRYIYMYIYVCVCIYVGVYMCVCVLVCVYLSRIYI